MSSATRILAVLVLSVAPSLLSAQRVASTRAGVVPRVALELPVRANTVGVDSTAPRRSRVHDAVVGGSIGLLVGLVAGDVQAHRDERGCRGDMCALSGLDVPILGAIGLVAGAVIGAVWPTH